MGKKTFRPPQAIRETVEAAGDTEAPLLKADSIPIDGIRKMYASLLKARGEFTLENTKDYRTAGGTPGFKWSRRILRQEGLLKTAEAGAVQIPEAIDLQLGPELFACVLEKSCEEVASALQEAGVRGACVPLEKGTALFFPADVVFVNEGSVCKVYDEELGEVYELILGSSPFEKAEYDEAVIVEESREKVRVLLKANGTTGCSCYLVDASVSVAGLDVDELFLLKTEDESSSQTYAEVIKVDEELGLVFAWGIVCTIDDEEYYDLQGDHIPEASMLKHSSEFMLTKRETGEMHARTDAGTIPEKGTIVFAFPLTREVAKAFGINARVSGLMIGAKFDDESILQKFKDGEYTGFSIGGSRDTRHDEEVE